LGYWDYDLFDTIDAAFGCFLSRVKSNAVITICEIKRGIGKQFVGSILFQRLSYVVALLAQGFIKYITLSEHFKILKKKK